MKKILFLIYDLSHGGAEKVLVNLVNNMDPNKYDITVMTIINTGVHIKNLNSNIKYKYIFPYKVRGISKVLKLFSPEKLYKNFIKDDYDILVSYLEGAPARIISGCDDNNVKKIAWIHTEMGQLSQFKVGFRNKKEAQKSYKKFNKIICVSKGVKDNFIKGIGDDCEKKISVLYNTNETDLIIKQSLEKIADINFNPDFINVCSIGKVISVKGYDRLAKVHKKLIEEGYKLHIYIIGVGEMKKNIEQYLEQNGLSDTFTFIGYRDNPYKYLAKCDLYVCSSYREGFSTAVTEALIVGTPVISTKCSGVEELLGYNDEFGLAVENSEIGLYNGLKKMLENDSMREQYKYKSIEGGRRFGKLETVNKVESMFDSLFKDLGTGEL